MDVVGQVGRALADMAGELGEALERQVKEPRRLKKLEEILKSARPRGGAA